MSNLSDPTQPLDVTGLSSAQASEFMTQILLQTAESTSPLLRDLLCVAAIPRLFNAEMLATLLERDPGDTAFQDSWNRLLEYAFVEPRRNGAWSIHGKIRQLLCQYWQQDAERGTDFTTHIAALATVYRERYQLARTALLAAYRLQTVFEDADPHRFGSQRDAAEDALVRAGAELIHYSLRQSLSQGWDEFIVMFNELQTSSQFRLAGLLVRAWQSESGVLPTADQSLHNAWTKYFEAKNASGRGEYDKCLQILAEVPRPESVDIRYATWHHSVKADALLNLCKYREAISACDDEIAIHESSHVDDSNSYTAWAAKSAVYAELWESEEELENIEEALRRAEQYASYWSRVVITGAYAQSLGKAGRPNEAAIQTIAAIKQARLGWAESDWSRSVIPTTTRIAILAFGSRSPRTLATLSEQLDQLSTGEGPDGELNRLIFRAQVHAFAGDRRNAERLHDQASEFASRFVPSRRPQVALSRGVWLSSTGDPRQGAEVNLASLANDEIADSPRERAQALTNAAMDFLKAGLYEQSDDCLQQAVILWEKIGHRNAVGYSRALSAELRRRQGDLKASGALLEEADVGPARGYGANRLLFAGRLALDEARYSEGTEFALAASDLAISTSNYLDAIDSRALALQCLVAELDFERARRVSGELDALLKSLQEFDSWAPSKESRRADAHAANAIRILRDGLGSKRERARSALEHLETAIHLDGASAWVLVEAALVDRVLGRTASGLARLRSASDLTDDSTLLAAVAWLAKNFD